MARRRDDRADDESEPGEDDWQPRDQWIDLEHLVQLLWILLAGVGVVFGLLFLPTAITDLATKDGLEIAGLGLLVVVFISLGGAYFYAATTEKARLQRIAPELTAPLPSYLPVLVLVMVLTWIALACAIFWPPVFALVLTLLKAEESINAWVAKRHIRREAARLLGTEGLSRAARWRISVVVTYYFAHPWDPLLALEMLLLSAAASAGAYLAATDPQTDGFGMFLVCIAVAGIVLVNELVAYRWRVTRNLDIDRRPPASFPGDPSEARAHLLPEREV